jgi:hypothetical protein
MSRSLHPRDACASSASVLVTPAPATAVAGPTVLRRQVCGCHSTRHTHSLVWDMAHLCATPDGTFIAGELGGTSLMHMYITCSMLVPRMLGPDAHNAANKQAQLL